MLSELEKALYKTRKSVLEACREIDIEYTDTLKIRLKQCNSCGVWDKKMFTDLDGLDICKECLEFYGP